MKLWTKTFLDKGGAGSRALSLESQKGWCGVPIGAQWLTNPTRNHEVAGSVPALVQWGNDPVLP